MKKSSHLERILGKLDDLDPSNLSILVQRLARERHLMETVFNTIQEGVLVIDREGTIQYSNTAADSLIGLKDQDLGKAILWKLVPNLLQSLPFEALDHEVAASSREVEITYPELRHVRLFIVPIHQDKFKSDEGPLFAVILLDVTEDKVQTEEMIENEKVSSIFKLAAGVAHELGNPLNSITIHLQLIQRKLESLGSSQGLDKVSESVNICLDEVDRLDKIIDNFLHAVRPSQPDLSEVNLLEVLDEVIAFQSQELKNRGIRVEIQLESSLPIVLADRNQVKQVFFNVVKNAMEAMSASGELKISTDSTDSVVSISFSDNGQGVSEETLAKIFDPYYSTKEGGHGLGMMIVQRIMREHGGQIAIDSKPNRGTTITLEFPMQQRRFKMLEGDQA